MNKKGVSITALIMYVVALTSIVAVIAVFNVNIINNSEKFVKTSKIYEQYMIFNMFFLETMSNASSVTYTDSQNIVLLGRDSSVVGRYSYNSANSELTYTYGTNTITICKLLSDINFVSGVNNSINVSLEFAVDDVAFEPINFNYAIGSDY